MSNAVTVPKLYYPLFDDTVTEVVEPSGRCTAKTTSNEIYAVTMMMADRRNNVWYCRAEKGDIRETIFSSMINTIQLMGLERMFVWSLSPFQITCLQTGAKCYFSGINGKTDDDMTATKGFTPNGNTLAICILDEADQVKHFNHITAWESTAYRFLLPHGKMVYAYNPPMNRHHWAYTFFGDKVKNGATRIYATWKDIYKLLPIKTIQQIEKFAKDDPEYYRYWYLGAPVNFRGMVYPQFNREKQTRDVFEFFAERDRVVELHIGLDEGTAFDSTCATPIAIWQSGRALVLDCLEIDPVKTGQLAPTETSRRLWEWLQDLLNNKFPFLQHVPRRWIFESAEGGQQLRLQFVNDFGEDCRLVTHKSITGDIKRVRSMLNDGVLFFYDSPHVNTRQLMDDIEGYVFDEKTNLPKKGQRDDTIDSLEYGTKLYYDSPITIGG